MHLAVDTISYSGRGIRKSKLAYNESVSSDTNNKWPVKVIQFAGRR